MNCNYQQFTDECMSNKFDQDFNGDFERGQCRRPCARCVNTICFYPDYLYTNENYHTTCHKQEEDKCQTRCDKDDRCEKDNDTENHCNRNCRKDKNQNNCRWFNGFCSFCCRGFRR